MNKINNFQLDHLICAAFQEDIPYEDLSTNAIYTNQQATVELIAKQEGIIAGLFVFKRVFEYLDQTVVFETFKEDGDKVTPGNLIMVINGPVNVLLSGERIALNFMQRMSGIATATSQMVTQLAGTGIKLMDTRKTTPGLRALEKYAVKIGGGHNHRFSLSDQIMLKDNHVSAAGGVAAAVQMAKDYAPYVKIIEVEAETVAMAQAAADAGADIIMLDNMNYEEMQTAIAVIDGRAIVEVSGNIDAASIDNYKTLKIDYISSGAITHSAGVLDLSMKNLTIAK